MTSMGRDTVTEGVLVGLTTTQLQAICRSTCSSSSCLARESSLSFFSGSASSIFATGDASGAQFGMTKSGSYGLTGLGKQAVRNELATMQHPWTSRRNWVPTSRLVTPALSWHTWWWRAKNTQPFWHAPSANRLNSLLLPLRRQPTTLKQL